MKHCLGSLRILAIIALAVLGGQTVTHPTWAEDQTIVVASTTSTQDSGLFSYLLPIVKQKTGLEAKVALGDRERADPRFFDLERP